MTINAAVDVGKFENLGVFIQQPPTDYSKDNFFEYFCNLVASSGKGVIGFEAPLFVPAYSIKKIGVIRCGVDAENRVVEIDRRKCVWHSPVGAGVTIRGIVLLKLLFQQLTERVKHICVYTDYETFKNASTGILIYESYISGTGAPKTQIPQDFVMSNEHDQDAALSAYLFLQKEKQKGKTKLISTDAYVNLPLVIAQSFGLNVCSPNSGFLIRAFKPEKGKYDDNYEYFSITW